MGVQVVQGMLLTRPGFEERVKANTNMQDMLKWLPSDLFRTCLARVGCRTPQVRVICVFISGPSLSCMLCVPTSPSLLLQAMSVANCATMFTVFLPG